MDKLDEICANCSCTFGAHSAASYYSDTYKQHIYINQCPGHEGRMDWDEGPGTIFEPTGKYKEKEQNDK